MCGGGRAGAGGTSRPACGQQRSRGARGAAWSSGQPVSAWRCCGVARWRPRRHREKKVSVYAVAAASRDSGTRDPGHPSLLSGAHLWKMTYGCWVSALRVRQSARAAVGDNLGDPFSEIPGSLVLRDLGWGAQGSEASERGTQRPPRGCSPVAASGTRPPQGARGPSEERRRLSRVFRTISLLVTRVLSTHLPRFHAEGIWIQALLFGEGSSRCLYQPKGSPCPLSAFSLGSSWASIGSAWISPGHS